MFVCTCKWSCQSCTSAAPSISRLNAGVTDGWTDGWMDGWMPQGRRNILLCKIVLARDPKQCCNEPEKERPGKILQVPILSSSV